MKNRIVALFVFVAMSAAFVRTSYGACEELKPSRYTQYKGPTGTASTISPDCGCPEFVALAAAAVIFALKAYRTCMQDHLPAKALSGHVDQLFDLRQAA